MKEDTVFYSVGIITLVLWSASTTLMLSGCTASPDEQARNLQAAKQVDVAKAAAPEYVVTLADGRDVYRIQVTAVPANGTQTGVTSYPHWIYFVGQDVTINRKVQQGKHNRHETQVLLGAPKPTSKVDSEKVAASILDDMSLRESEERAILQKLKSKYEGTK